MCSKKENSRWLHRQLQWKWFCFPLYILHHWHCYELSLLTLEWMWLQLPSPEWMGVRICNSVPELPAQSLEWKPGHLPALWEIHRERKNSQTGDFFQCREEIQRCWTHQNRMAKAPWKHHCDVIMEYMGMGPCKQNNCIFSETLWGHILPHNLSEQPSSFLGLEMHPNVGNALGYPHEPESTDLKRVHNK